MNKMLVGINPALFIDYSGDFALANRFTMARSIDAGVNPPPLGPDLYPASNFNQVIWTSPPNSPVTGGGVYAVRFKGLSDLYCSFQHWTVGPNRTSTQGPLQHSAAPIRLDAFDSVSGISEYLLTIETGFVGSISVGFDNTQRSPSDPMGSGVSDIQIMGPSHQDSMTPLPYTAFLTDAFRELVSPTPLIRWMDPSNTNRQGSFHLEWNQRTPGKAPNWSGGYTGTIEPPWEGLVRCSNELKQPSGSQAWFNIPVGATDDYVLKMAQMLRYGTDGLLPYTGSTGSNPVPADGPVLPALDPEITIYLENSNELTFNTAFGAFAINLTLAQQEVAAGGSSLNYDGEPSPYAWAFRRAARRIMEISDIFRGVFGDAAMMTRVRPVIFGQAGGGVGPSLSVGMAYLEAWFGSAAHVANPRPVKSYLYGGGVSDYRDYGVKVTDGSVSADAVFASGMPDGPYDIVAFFKSYGLAYGFYEGNRVFGGDYASEFTLMVNQDPRAREAMLEWLSDCNAHDYDFGCIFNSTQLNYAIATDAWHLGSPRYLGLQDYQAATNLVKGSAIPDWVDVSSGYQGNRGYGGHNLIYWTYNRFPEACVLQFQVYGNQATAGDSLAVVVDGVELATGHFAPTSISANSYSSILQVPVPAGLHAVHIKATASVNLDYQSLVTIKRASGPTVETNFATAQFGSAPGTDLASLAGTVWAKGAGAATDGASGVTLGAGTTRYVCTTPPPGLDYGIELQLTASGELDSVAILLRANAQGNGYSAFLAGNTVGLLRDGGLVYSRNLALSSLNGTFTLTALVSGPVMSFLIDGNRVFDAYDPNPTPMEAGLGGFAISGTPASSTRIVSYRQFTTAVGAVSLPIPTPTPTPTPTPIPAGTVSLFSLQLLLGHTS